MAENFIGSEEQILPKLGEVHAGKTWSLLDDRFFSRNLDDYVDLYSYFSPLRGSAPPGGNSHRLAYLGQYIWSSTQKEVLLALGFNEMIAVFWNGTRIFQHDLSRTAMRDDFKIKVSLKAGWNRLLIKIANLEGAWGLYFGIRNLSDDAWLSELEFSPTKPDESSLEIETIALPSGESSQPFVGLNYPAHLITNPAVALSDVPSASPFRFTASGGTPPYHWSVSALPKGLSLNANEGEITGQITGESCKFLLSLFDARSHERTREFNFHVKSAVNFPAWLLNARLGGLQHGLSGYDYPNNPSLTDELGRFLKDLGYAWIAPTFLATSGFKPNGRPGLADYSAYQKRMEENGIRVGTYLGYGDIYVSAKAVGLPASLRDVSDYNIEIISQMANTYKPALVWIDGLVVFPGVHPDSQGRPVPLELDALYSAAKSISPSTLIVANGADQPVDYLGDMDILAHEGMNDGLTSVNLPWDRWPNLQTASLNPKLMPLDSWRYVHPTNPTGLDEREWLKSFIAMLSEPENLVRPRLIDMDATIFQALDVYLKIHAWWKPRKTFFQGHLPYHPRVNPDWGYVLQNSKDPRKIHVIVTRNPRGKIGASPSDGSIRFSLQSPVEKTPSAKIFPSGMPIPINFVAATRELILDISRVGADWDSEIGTLIEISL